MPQKKSAPPKKPLIPGGLPRVPPAMSDDDWLRKAAAQLPRGMGPGTDNSAMPTEPFADAESAYELLRREAPGHGKDIELSGPELPRGVGPGTDDSLAIPFNPGMMRNPYKYGIPAMKNIALPGGQQDIPLPKKKK